jgi:6-phosphogluconate dehydrogenase
MLSTLAEAWSFLQYGLELDCDTIAAIFDQWNDNGELQGTYMLDIAADMLHAKKSSCGTDRENDSNEHYMLDEVPN